MKSSLLILSALLATGAAFALAHGHGHRGHGQQAQEYGAGADAAPGAVAYAVVAHFVPVKGYERDLLDVMKKMSVATESQPGLLQYLIVKPREGGGKKAPITVISMWKSKRDLETFSETELFREIHGDEAVKAVHGWIEDSWIVHSDVMAAWPPAPKQGHGRR